MGRGKFWTGGGGTGRSGRSVSCRARWGRYSPPFRHDEVTAVTTICQLGDGINQLDERPERPFQPQHRRASFTTWKVSHGSGARVGPLVGLRPRLYLERRAVRLYSPEVTGID